MHAGQLCACFLHTCLGDCTGKSFSDSTSLLAQLEDILQMEHSRRRSVNGFLVNFLRGLIALCTSAKETPFRSGGISVSAGFTRTHVNFRHAAEQLEAGDQTDRQDVTVNARGYAVLLRQPIMKEDNILFPMAEWLRNHLSESPIIRIQTGFQLLRRDPFRFRLNQPCRLGVLGGYTHRANGYPTRIGNCSVR